MRFFDRLKNKDWEKLSSISYFSISSLQRKTKYKDRTLYNDEKSAICRAVNSAFALDVDENFLFDKTEYNSIEAKERFRKRIDFYMESNNTTQSKVFRMIEEPDPFGTKEQVNISYRRMKRAYDYGGTNLSLREKIAVCDKCGFTIDYLIFKSGSIISKS